MYLFSHKDLSLTGAASIKETGPHSGEKSPPVVLTAESTNFENASAVIELKRTCDSSKIRPAHLSHRPLVLSQPCNGKKGPSAVSLQPGAGGGGSSSLIHGESSSQLLGNVQQRQEQLLTERTGRIETAKGEIAATHEPFTHRKKNSGRKKWKRHRLRRGRDHV